MIPESIAIDSEGFYVLQPGEIPSSAIKVSKAIQREMCGLPCGVRVMSYSNVFPKSIEINSDGFYVLQPGEISSSAIKVWRPQSKQHS